MPDRVPLPTLLSQVLVAFTLEFDNESERRFDDSLVLGPSSTLTFDYVEDNPGDWLCHCHVAMHMMGGMIGCCRVTA
jgi:FtsP/CotA-like multicopper oxidase with cupredoxin domain